MLETEEEAVEVVERGMAGANGAAGKEAAVAGKAAAANTSGFLFSCSWMRTEETATQQLGLSNNNKDSELQGVADFQEGAARRVNRRRRPEWTAGSGRRR